MKYLAPLLPFLAGWALLLFIPDYFGFALINGVGQLLLFTFVVCIPAWMTGRLSYVDIGWPLGLMLIGLITLAVADGYTVRKLTVSAVYLFVGLRMAAGSIHTWRLGYFKTEFPRYQYQRRRWERAGVKNVPLMIQIEALWQGIANASFLGLPAIVIASNSNPTISSFEIAGLIIWACAFAMETVADRQKFGFLRQMKRAGQKKQVCNVGLWRYSRHPNYFAEWMVWNALVVAAIPSWLALYGNLHLILWIFIGLGLFNTSRCMYMTLVHFTGAKPSEFYSVQKRPDYKIYQQTTNMFFPGPPKRREVPPS
jgi:steroid 5-alpha reductase family enzyme